jgi:3-oxoacyl-[acyl-carrier-protein] synthase-1
MGDLDFRITDISGEQYYFKENALVLLRLLRTRKATFDIWHPADCIGEVGCVQAAVMLMVIKAAVEKDYSEGSNILAQLGDEGGKRAAMILSRQGGAQNG